MTELLDVKGFTPATLYDPPTTQSASNPLPNLPDGRTPTLSDLVTTDSVTSLVNAQGRPLAGLRQSATQAMNRLGIRDRIGQQRFRAAAAATTWAQFIRLYPTITVQQLRTLVDTYYVGTSATPTGKINPNTASQAVLQTIPNLTPDEATSIINQQNTGITQMGSLLTIPGMTTVQSARNFLDFFGLKSETFLVRVIGTVGATSVPLEAVVKVNPPAAGATAATAQIIRMEEQPFHDPTGRWGWSDTTTNDVTLEAGS